MVLRRKIENVSSLVKNIELQKEQPDLKISTPKLRYNESRYSEFLDIVNKCQLPYLLRKSRYSEQKGPDKIVRYTEVWV